MPALPTMANVGTMRRGVTQMWAQARTIDARRPEWLDTLIALGLFAGAALSGAVEAVTAPRTPRSSCYLPLAPCPT